MGPIFRLLIHAVNDYHSRYAYSSPPRPERTYRASSGDACCRRHRSAAGRQKHARAVADCGRTPLSFPGRLRRSGLGSARSGSSVGGLHPSHARRSPKAAKPALSSEASHRQAAPNGAILAHRLGQLAAHAPGIRIPGRARQLPRALANDPPRAAWTRPLRPVGRAAGHPGERMDGFCPSKSRRHRARAWPTLPSSPHSAPNTASWPVQACCSIPGPSSSGSRRMFWPRRGGPSAEGLSKGISTTRVAPTSVFDVGATAKVY
jgi:hypothetical protein